MRVVTNLILELSGVIIVIIIDTDYVSRENITISATMILSCPMAV